MVKIIEENETRCVITSTVGAKKKEKKTPNDIVGRERLRASDLIACENIRFSSKRPQRRRNEEKWMFSQATDLTRGTQRGYSSKPLNIALLNVF